MPNFLSIGYKITLKKRTLCFGNRKRKEKKGKTNKHIEKNPTEINY
jgi:hypothetical protein